MDRMIRCRNIQARKTRNDFTVNSYFIYIVAFINSIAWYRDLGGTGTVKIWYRGIPWYREYRPSL